MSDEAGLPAPDGGPRALDARAAGPVASPSTAPTGPAVPVGPPRALHPLSRLAWRTLAVVCILLGLIGVALPVLPTVPFLLVAAWAAGRGWPRLERWLLDHPRHGPPLRRWRERRSVPRRAKWWASASMAASSALVAFSPAPLAVKLALPCGMAAVALWLWLRPED